VDSDCKMAPKQLVIPTNVSEEESRSLPVTGAQLQQSGQRLQNGTHAPVCHSDER
jgi:hypothetical protein